MLKTSLVYCCFISLFFFNNDVMFVVKKELNNQPKNNQPATLPNKKNIHKRLNCQSDASCQSKMLKGSIESLDVKHIIIFYTMLITFNNIR